MKKPHKAQGMHNLMLHTLLVWVYKVFTAYLQAMYHGRRDYVSRALHTVLWVDR